jgi:hypothetical protein
MPRKSPGFPGPCSRREDPTAQSKTVRDGHYVGLGHLLFKSAAVPAHLRWIWATRTLPPGPFLLGFKIWKFLQ